jgi:hypothetical protein
MGEEAECRICGDLVPIVELVEPCLCRGGMRWAHKSCVQTWISTDKGPGRPNDACEVCGGTWVGEYDIPEPSVQSPEEYARRVHVLLSSSYVRVMMDVPRAQDEHLLRHLGPHVPGPWLEWLRRDGGRSRSVFVRWKERAVRAMSLGGRQNVGSVAVRRSALRANANANANANAGPTRRQPSSCGCFGMGAREEGGRGRRGRRGGEAAVQPPGDQRA